MHEFFSAVGIKWLALGIAGGIAKVLVQLNSMEKFPSPLRIVALLVMNGFVSGFSGFMGAVFMSTLTPNDDWHVFAAGIFGYMGVTALDYFSKVVQRVRST
jgi:predicted CDP-diglyceride synthetase/phosphatidate cytidylyltransferase